MDVTSTGYASGGFDPECLRDNRHQRAVCMHVLDKNADIVNKYPANQYSREELVDALWGFSYWFHMTGAMFKEEKSRRSVNSSRGLSRSLLFPGSEDSMKQMDVPKNASASFPLSPMATERLLKEDTYVVDDRRITGVSLPRVSFVDMLNLPRNLVSQDMRPMTPGSKSYTDIFVTLTGIDFYLDLYDRYHMSCMTNRLESMSSISVL